MALTSNGLLNMGQTTHYQFQYEDAIGGGLEPARTNQVIVACETDFDQMSRWFGNLALDIRPPICVNVAHHDSRTLGNHTAGEFTVTINPGHGNATAIRYLLVAEMAEQFMRSQNRGWFGSGADGSRAAGLARFLSAHFLRINALGDPPAAVGCVNAWLMTARVDYLNNASWADDGPDASVGCCLLFIHYLHSQLGFSIEAIVAAGADTLAGVHRNLTGEEADPFPHFKHLLDSAYPGTTEMPGANPGHPFPLPVSASFSSKWAISPVSASSSLYLVGLDEGVGGGRVWSNCCPDPDHPGRWAGWLPLSDNAFPPGAPITALSNGPGATSLYLVGLDGKVWSNLFPAPERAGRWRGWFQLGPNTFPKNSLVTATSTLPGSTSLYLVGLDEEVGGGRVWSNLFPDPEHPGHWTGWYPLGDNPFQPGVPVTALSNGPGATSLYLLGLDGQVWSNFFPAPERPGQWKGWFPLGPNTFPKNSLVAAISTVPGGTSLYLVGPDEGHGGGRVWSKYFPDPDHPGHWTGWFSLDDAVFRPGVPVTAVSTGAGASSLYVMGLDGRVWSNVFPSAARPGQWKGWFALGPEIFPMNSVVAANTSVPGGTGLYLVGLYERPGGGRVWSKFLPDPDLTGQRSVWFPVGDNMFPIPK